MATPLQRPKKTAAPAKSPSRKAPGTKAPVSKAAQAPSKQAAKAANTKTQSATPPAVRTTRAYLRGPERQQQIVQGAIQFFAEKGFAGSTRDLAKSLGIAHGLLFKYFPTKEDLIEQVYIELFENRWRQGWKTSVQNRALDLEERLMALYIDYAQVIHRYEWVRNYLFGGLNGTQIGNKYWAFIRENLFQYVIDELRLEHGKPPISELPPLEAEYELMWSLHASLFYIGVRQWVHMLDVPTDREGNIRQIVQGFLDAAPRVLAQVNAPKQARPAKPTNPDKSFSPDHFRAARPGYALQKRSRRAR